MSADQPGGRQVDLDLLADYACGALDGTPAAEQVAALVTTDAGWIAMYQALRAAEPMVSGQLSALGATPEVLPADVALRLDEALRTAGHPAGAAAAVAGPGAEVVSLATRRRRRARVLAAAAAVVGVLGIGTVGAIGLVGQNGGTATSAQQESGATDLAGPSAAGGDAGRTPRDNGLQVPNGKSAPAAFGGLLVSGTDYQPDTLRSLPDRLGLSKDSLAPELAATVPTELARLTEPGLLRQCLAAVTTRHPGSTQVVDFARYQGNPALIILVAGAAGDRLVVVAGPACGGTGPDERFTAPL